MKNIYYSSKKVVATLVQDKIVLLAGLGLLLLLLAKNPFSERNLISNMEPFPDAFHYTVPAISFASGEGFYFQREGRHFSLGVPPLYSIYLIPFYLINKSPQMFYFGNIILSLGSAFLFFRVLQFITERTLVKGIGFLFYLTNYYIYWYPNLAMAENLTLFMFLLSLNLLFFKSNFRIWALEGFTTVSLYGIKFASLPASAALFLTYALKIIFTEKKKFKALLVFVSLTIFCGMTLYLYERLFLNKDVLISVANFLFPAQTKENYYISQASASNTWFSVSFISKNFPIYFNSLIGKPNRFLWDTGSLVPAYIAIPGLIGVFTSLFRKKTFFMGVLIILLNFWTILFMSTFYTTDNRYIYIALPSLLIGFVLLSDWALRKVKNKRIELLLIGFLIGLTFFYIYQNANRIKSQISINLRYAENPWYYIAAKNFDSYFEENKQPDKKVILITTLPPYYVDFFVKSKPKLLPLSYWQDFHDDKEKAWGIDQDVNLIDLYKKYFDEGYEMYVSNSGMGNESYNHIDFGKIKANFELVKVRDGCFDSCNIYKLESKKNE